MCLSGPNTGPVILFQSSMALISFISHLSSKLNRSYGLKEKQMTCFPI